MYEGLDRVQRRKLARFVVLARKGARARVLLRPIIGEPVLMKHPVVVEAMMAIRLRKAPPNGWKPQGRKGTLSREDRLKRQFMRSPRLLDDKGFMEQFSDKAVSLLRTFITMGKRVRALTARGQ